MSIYCIHSTMHGLAGLPTRDGIHSIQSADGKRHLHCLSIQIIVGGSGDWDIADGIVVSSVEKVLLPLQAMWSCEGSWLGRSEVPTYSENDLLILNASQALPGQIPQRHTSSSWVRCLWQRHWR